MPPFRALAAATLLIVSAVDAQQPASAAGYEIHRDVIRGRVTTDSGSALAGALVAATMAPERQFQLDTTDADGHYEIVFEKGTGDFLVHISFPNRIAFRKRLMRAGQDSVFTVDAVLKANVQQLAPVQVSARRSRPARETGNTLRAPGIGAAEQSPGGVNGFVGPDQAANLDALASALPGVNLVQGGISVLGLGSDQNRTTLNGLDFGGGVPRGAQTGVSVSTSTYDPARGGFGGALTQVSLGPGNVNTSRRAYFTLDAPQLQAGDAIARRSGAHYTTLDFNYGSDGTTNMDRWVYNYGLEFNRKISDAVSLLSADAGLLRTSGVASDSVNRVLATLSALRIPSNTSDVSSARVTDYGSVMARVDRPLFDYSTFTPKNTTWGVLGYANWNHNGPLALGPTITPASGGQSTQIRAGGQYIYSAYFGKLKDQLTEVRTGIQYSGAGDDAYLRLPSGRVLVSSSFTDGSNGVASLGFGGNSQLRRQNANVSWHTTSETQFFWRGRAAHRGKVFAESRVERFSEELPSNRLGSFSYNSIADLQANVPSSFSRTIGSNSRSGGEWSGALAASDRWTANSKFTLLYGARVEGNAFTSAPAYNPALFSSLGVRTDQAPSGWHISPRAGFNWLVTTGARGAGNAGYYSQVGQFTSMARGVIRGGVGEFRQRLQPSLLANAMGATGLPSGTQRLACLGPATPTPDWTAWLADESTIPTSCAGAVTPAGFSDASPSVQFFDRNFQPARSWRSNLSWGSAFRKVMYSVDAIYTWNLDQPDLYDVNFRGVPQFVLPGESSRPVFVPQSSIIGSTGAVAAGVARIDPSFGPVLGRRSDLRGWARQVTVRARPGLAFVGGRSLLDVSYTFTDARSQSRGFDGAGLGDPRAVEWTHSEFAPTHEVTLQAGFSGRLGALTVAGKVSSGTRYTPLVAGDINGDGLANDRAFIFTNATAGDATLASAMQALRASTSAGARACLANQADRVAARSSCVTPWYSTINLNYSVGQRILNKLKLGRRPGVALYVANPLAGLDQLLHGNELRGWGSLGTPDRVLYYVRGYDSTTKRFKYEVNPRFGDTRPSANPFRAPFRVTLDFRMDLSRDANIQQMDRMLAPGRRGNPGTKLDSAAILKRYCGNLPDWYSQTIALTDSLLLTRDQVEALQAAKVAYSKRIADHWGAWAGKLAGVPDNFNVFDLKKQDSLMVNAAWELARLEAKATLPRILSPVQLKLLPSYARTFVESKEPITGMRYFSSSGC
jgi:hypothetical protein